MKKLLSIMLGLTIALGAITVSFAADDKGGDHKEKKAKKKKAKKAEDTK